MMLHYIFILYQLPATGAGASHYCQQFLWTLTRPPFQLSVYFAFTKNKNWLTIRWWPEIVCKRQHIIYVFQQEQQQFITIAVAADCTFHLQHIECWRWIFIFFFFVYFFCLWFKANLPLRLYFFCFYFYLLC